MALTPQQKQAMQEWANDALEGTYGRPESIGSVMAMLKAKGIDPAEVHPIFAKAPPKTIFQKGVAVAKKVFPYTPLGLGLRGLSEVSEHVIEPYEQVRAKKIWGGKGKTSTEQLLNAYIRALSQPAPKPGESATEYLYTPSSKEPYQPSLPEKIAAPIAMSAGTDLLTYLGPGLLKYPLKAAAGLAKKIPAIGRAAETMRVSRELKAATQAVKEAAEIESIKLAEEAHQNLRGGKAITREIGKKVTGGGVLATPYTASIERMADDLAGKYVDKQLDAAETLRLAAEEGAQQILIKRAKDLGVRRTTKPLYPGAVAQTLSKAKVELRKATSQLSRLKKVKKSPPATPPAIASTEPFAASLAPERGVVPTEAPPAAKVVGRNKSGIEIRIGDRVKAWENGLGQRLEKPMIGTIVEHPYRPGEWAFKSDKTGHVHVDRKPFVYAMTKPRGLAQASLSPAGKALPITSNIAGDIDLASDRVDRLSELVSDLDDIANQRFQRIRYNARLAAEPEARQAAARAGDEFLAEAAKTGIDPNDIKRLAEHYTKFDDYLRDVAIKANVFTESTRQKWQGLHLRRIYELYDGDEGAFLNALKESDPEKFARLEMQKAARWYRPAVSGTLPRAVRMRRDMLPEALRQEMWEMPGAFLRAERGANIIETGIQAGLFQKGLAPLAKLEYVEGYVPIEKAPRLLPLFREVEKQVGGPVTELFLPREAAAPLLELGWFRQAAKKAKNLPLWGTGLRAWKLMRTAYSVPTAVGNLIGGMIQENLPGRVPAALIPAARTAALYDLTRNGPATQEYRRISAGLGATFARIEFGAKERMARPGHIGEEVWEHIQSVLRAPQEAYSKTDQWTRTSIFIANRWMGKTAEEAAKIADAAAIRYDRMGPAVDFLSSSLMPFGRFLFGSIGPFTKAAVERPAPFLNWYRSIKSVEESVHPRAQVEAERILLPDYMKKYAFRLPWKDQFGRSQWANLRYTFPLLGEETGESLAGIMGPVASVISAVNGIDTFQGRRIWQADDPMNVKVAQSLIYLTGSLLPRWPIPAKFGIAARAKTALPYLKSGSEKLRKGEPLTAVEMRYMRSAPSELQAILRTYGIRVSSLSPETSYRDQYLAKKRQISYLENRLVELGRSEGTPAKSIQQELLRSSWEKAVDDLAEVQKAAQQLGLSLIKQERQ